MLSLRNISLYLLCKYFSLLNICAVPVQFPFKCKLHCTVETCVSCFLKEWIQIQRNTGNIFQKQFCTFNLFPNILKVSNDFIIDIIIILAKAMCIDRFVKSFAERVNTNTNEQRHFRKKSSYLPYGYALLHSFPIFYHVKPGYVKLRELIRTKQNKRPDFH